MHPCSPSKFAIWQENVPDPQVEPSTALILGYHSLR